MRSIVFVVCLIPGWHFSGCTVWPDLASPEAPWHPYYPAPCDSLHTLFSFPSWQLPIPLPGSISSVCQQGERRRAGGWWWWWRGSTSCSGIRTDTRPWPVSPNDLAHVKSTLKGFMEALSWGFSILVVWIVILLFFNAKKIKIQSDGVLSSRRSWWDKLTCWSQPAPMSSRSYMWLEPSGVFSISKGGGERDNNSRWPCFAYE